MWSLLTLLLLEKHELYPTGYQLLAQLSNELPNPQFMGKQAQCRRMKTFPGPTADLIPWWLKRETRTDSGERTVGRGQVEEERRQSWQCWGIWQQVAGAVFPGTEHRWVWDILELDLCPCDTTTSPTMTGADSQHHSTHQSYLRSLKNLDAHAPLWTQLRIFKGGAWAWVFFKNSIVDFEVLPLGGPRAEHMSATVSRTAVAPGNSNLGQRLKRDEKEKKEESGPVVKTLPSNAGGAGSIPGWGAEIPCALRPKNQNIKQKQYCNKFNKDF